MNNEKTIRAEYVRTIMAAISAAIALAALLLGGGWFWNNVWDVPDVRYTILPVYELNDQAFGGVVIENRGRSTARDVYILIKNLNTTIRRLKIDTDEPYKILEGGEGSDRVAISQDMLTAGLSTSVYLLTPEKISLSFEGKTLMVRSHKGLAHPSPSPETPSWNAILVGLLIGFLLAGIIGFLANRLLWMWGMHKIRVARRGLREDLEKK